MTDMTFVGGYVHFPVGIASGIDVFSNAGVGQRQHRCTCIIMDSVGTYLSRTNIVVCCHAAAASTVYLHPW